MTLADVPGHLGQSWVVSSDLPTSLAHILGQLKGNHQQLCCAGDLSGEARMQSSMDCWSCWAALAPLYLILGQEGLFSG